ncbi:MAG TPA: hypothetical protein VGO57_10770 [Verrucomicrobiae bacterium]|jgi:hypothetical protein
MKKRHKMVLVAGIFSVALLSLFFLLRPGAFSFFARQIEGIGHAGTWEDDPQNWYRAFKESQPAQVKVVHSKYWRSNHFTEEFIYFFEIEASPEWLRAFLKQRGLTQVAPEKVGSFRANINSSDAPIWFAPDPVGLYEVWDRPGYFGSVWINRTNGHIYFYDMQL